MSGTELLVAGVELGGTKSIAVLARGSVIIDRLACPTTSPDETLETLTAQLESWSGNNDIAALGIASFGPLHLDPASPGFGSIAATPKPGWAGIKLTDYFTRRFPMPIDIDTDVAGAALAEYRWGACAGADVLVYVTIGTGVGAGIVVGGRAVHGMAHPEAGHIRVRRVADDAFAGSCPFHGDCLEGLVSGPAIAARTGVSADRLDAAHPVWSQVADEVAEFMTTLILTLAPRHILIGGGVGCAPSFPLENIRQATIGRLGGYVAGIDGESIGRQIVTTTLGQDAGPLGAAAVAYAALEARQSSV